MSIETIKYPVYNDIKTFQKKITLKKEFNLKQKNEKTCSSADVFELESHQEFVKRFISHKTPYNGLLLFHGLGSGKTCSSIGIAEENRKFNEHNPKYKKTIIVASPNVIENFKLQLFNKNKLKNKNGVWTLEGCIGNSLLNDIDTYKMSKEEIILSIKQYIKKNYIFMGYLELANIIDKLTKFNNEVIKEKLKKEFENCMLIVDEAHNIRKNDTDDKKKIYDMFKKLFKNGPVMKVIFLTGTPIYNDHSEVVTLLNLLHMNDNREPIKYDAIFKKDGTLKDINNLKILLNGYVSYVRGENPYTFPHLIYPSEFENESSIKNIKQPELKYNGDKLLNNIQHLDIYISKLDNIQQEFYYDYIKKNNKYKESKELNYTLALSPIQLLNITYPTEKGYLLGDEGFNKTMKRTIRKKIQYEYINKNHIFMENEIGKYSIKIKRIIESINNSRGIILVYSQFLSSGIIPLAISLEECGFNRYGGKKNNLLKKDNIKDTKMNYSIICGDTKYSPNIQEEINALTNNNKNGENIKVVLITKTGTEGLDLNNIRQVHIMEPWYNMNRIEQIIGRAKRKCSHTNLNDQERNVQIFLHSAITNDTIETIDMYLYRMAETKSIQIGKINKIIKSMSVDCLLNNSNNINNKIVKLKLSNNKVIEYNIGDKPYSSICDYDKECSYECNIELTEKDTIDNTTYSLSNAHNDFIIYDIKKLFNEKHIYRIADIKDRYKFNNNINDDNIYYAIDYLLKQDIIDKYGTKGKIIKISDLLLFQPNNIESPYISTYERINDHIKPLHFTIDVEHINNNNDDDFFIDIDEKLNEMIKIMSNVEDKYINNILLKEGRYYLIEHLFDMETNSDNLINILNNLEKKKTLNENEKIFYNLFKKYKIDNNILLCDLELKMYSKYNDKWIYIDSDNYQKFKKKIINFEIDDYNYKSLIEFVGHKKEKKIFKLIDISKKRNHIIKDNLYKDIILKNLKLKDIRYKINESTIIIEYLLRIYKNKKKDFFYQGKNKIIFISRIMNELLKID